MTTEAQHEQWLTIEELADHFKVARRTVDRWVEDGVPCVLVGRKRGRRFSIADVEAWLKERSG